MSAERGARVDAVAGKKRRFKRRLDVEEQVGSAHAVQPAPVLLRRSLLQRRPGADGAGEQIRQVVQQRREMFGAQAMAFDELGQLSGQCALAASGLVAAHISMYRSPVIARQPRSVARRPLAAGVTSHCPPASVNSASQAGALPSHGRRCR